MDEIREPVCPCAFCSLAFNDYYQKCMYTAAEGETQELFQKLQHLTARIAELEEAARWVPVGERLPTAEDADQYGSVSLWSPDTGIDLCAWADVCMMGWATHWRRPDAPKGEQL